MKSPIQRLMCLVILNAAAINAVAHDKLTTTEHSGNSHNIEWQSPSGDKLVFTAETINGVAVAEGDILLTGTQSEQSTRGLGVSSSSGVWLDGLIPYQLASTLTDTDLIDRINQAVIHWNDNSSIKLIARNNSNADQYPDYLVFEPSSSCASYVGRITGEQPLWVNESCSTGSIIHELGHAIGLLHEHTRPDRDQFVVINWENIRSGKDHNFHIPSGGIQALGEYDFGSIMHYGTTFFSSNGQETITPIQMPDRVSIGQRLAASTGDLQAVDLLYGTDLSLTQLHERQTPVAGEDIELNYSVTNNGSNGANEIMIIVQIDANDRLRSYSGDGWRCEQQWDLLLCGINTLADTAESQVSMILTAGYQSDGEYISSLQSRSYDTNTANNGASAPDNANQLHEEFFADPTIAAAASAPATDTAAADSTAVEGTTAANMETEAGSLWLTLMLMLMMLLATLRYPRQLSRTHYLNKK